MRRGHQALAAAILAAMLGLASVSQTSAQDAASALIAARTGPDGVVFTVPTGGCTSPADFRVAVQRGSGEAAVTLHRLTPDACKGFFPGGMEIAYSWAELGLPPGSALRIVNRIDPAAQPR